MAKHKTCMICGMTDINLYDKAAFTIRDDICKYCCRDEFADEHIEQIDEKPENTEQDYDS